MRHLFSLLLLLGLGWWAYKSGMIYDLSHSMNPEPGRACTVCGPVKSGVNMAFAKSDTKWIIDTHIGAAGEKLQSYNVLQNIIQEGGKVINLSDDTDVTVGESSTIKLYGQTYPVVKVTVESGDYKGQEGWVERENVIDTPIQQLFQSMRATTPAKSPRGVGDLNPGQYRD